MQHCIWRHGKTHHMLNVHHFDWIFCIAIAHINFVDLSNRSYRTSICCCFSAEILWMTEIYQNKVLEQDHSLKTKVIHLNCFDCLLCVCHWIVVQMGECCNQSDRFQVIIYMFTVNAHMRRLFKADKWAHTPVMWMQMFDEGIRPYTDNISSFSHVKSFPYWIKSTHY